MGLLFKKSISCLVSSALRSFVVMNVAKLHFTEMYCSSKFDIFTVLYKGLWKLQAINFSYSFFTQQPNFFEMGLYKSLNCKCFYLSSGLLFCHISACFSMPVWKYDLVPGKVASSTNMHSSLCLIYRLIISWNHSVCSLSSKLESVNSKVKL